MKKYFGIYENRVHPTVRLNAICPYFTMFPLTFPLKVLTRAKDNDIVYDPFCGRGTTNFAARLMGLYSYGVDSNPVAFAIAQSKLVRITPAEIISLCKEILIDTKLNYLPSSEFWQWAYHENTLFDICKIRGYLNSKIRLSEAEIALKAIMLGILHGPLLKEQSSYLSNQMPRTFATKPDYSVDYWKKRSLYPPHIDTASLVERKAHYVFNCQLPKKVSGKIIFGDSRKKLEKIDNKIDWIITSPPYFGMSTYEQDQWLRNWFLGGSENVEYSNKSQIKHWSERTFINDLSKVWANAAKKSKPGAKLVIRFGAIPSRSDKTPSELLKASLTMADSGWKLCTIKNAGKPMESRRQANQFKNTTGKYIEEIDAFAVLNT